MVIPRMQGGTAGAPEHLNDRNVAASEDVWQDDSRCDFVVALQRHDEPQLLGTLPLGRGFVHI